MCKDRVFVVCHSKFEIRKIFKQIQNKWLTPSNRRKSYRLQYKQNQIRNTMPSVHLYRVCHILIWREIPGYTYCPWVIIRTMKLIFRSSPARAILFPLVLTTTVRSPYQQLVYAHCMVLFRFQFFSLSQITVYIAIYIERKYKNDTSFDNGIHFHVNTMALKCKCF